MSEQTERHPPSSPWDEIYRGIRCLKIEVDGSIVTALLTMLDAARRQVEAQHQETVETLTAERDEARDVCLEWDALTKKQRAELATLRAQLTEREQEIEKLKFSVHDTALRVADRTLECDYLHGEIARLKGEKS